MKEKEISHYDNKNLWDRLSLSESNRQRIEETVAMIPEDVDSIADIGCGNGLFLNYIKRHLNLSKLVGVDFSEKAMNQLETPKMVGDITEIPLEEGSFDLVSALEVLEHLDLVEYKRAKEELTRVSSKYLLVSVPFSEDLELELVKCPNCKTRFNKSHHKRSFDEAYLKGLFKEEGYSCSNVKYISRRNMYFLLTPLLSSYRKLRGFRSFEGMVCPVCGYRIKNSEESNKKMKSVEGSSIPNFFKKIWPKKHTYKWIACLYSKIN